MPYYSFLHPIDRNIDQHEYYYDNDKIEWTKLLVNNYEIIKKEFLQFLSDHPELLEPYFAESMVNKKNKWKTIGFFFWGLRDNKNCRLCDNSFKIFNNIPGLVSVSFSLMEPNTEIKGHHGDTNAIFRCHLPLDIPDKLPRTGFKVGNEERSWEEGKPLIFNDGAYHTAWNKSDKRRIILMIDVIKPKFIEQKRWICSMVLSSLILQKHFQIVFDKKNRIFKNIFLYFTAIIIWYYFLLVNTQTFKYRGNYE